MVSQFTQFLFVRVEMMKSTKNIIVLVIDNVIILGFLLINTSPRQKKEQMKFTNCLLKTVPVLNYDSCLLALLLTISVASVRNSSILLSFKALETRLDFQNWSDHLFLM